MLRIPVYRTSGEVAREIEVEESRFGGQVRRELVRQAVLCHEANARLGTARAKGRSEVSGSGRKPWRQKGTGRARAGSRKSPIWVGGGVAHGPLPRDYSQKLNKKARRRALESALLAKMADGEVKVIDSLELAAPKTREVARILENIGVDSSFLIVLAERDAVLWRCTRNIAGSAMKALGELSAYDVLSSRQVVFSGEAFDELLRRADAAVSATGQGR